ncbi:MAG: hypothetical protein LKF52_02385 [Butyrivibrio sp.]|jgi:hypothetical protein|nr:hypothetical protein [Butyrivibrio sp.]
MINDTEEEKCLKLKMENISSLNILCRNYQVKITEGTEEEMVIRYHNNRFRKMIISRSSSGVRMEEQMAVTFYEFFRFMELMTDNVLEIEIPSACRNMNISVETGVTGIDVSDIGAQNLRLISSTGQIYIHSAHVCRRLSAVSSAGHVCCFAQGTESDYDIDCRADRKDVCQPFFRSDPSSPRKIFLRSNMYVPELVFI